MDHLRFYQTLTSYGLRIHFSYHLEKRSNSRWKQLNWWDTKQSSWLVGKGFTQFYKLEITSCVLKDVQCSTLHPVNT